MQGQLRRGTLAALAQTDRMKGQPHGSEAGQESQPETRQEASGPTEQRYPRVASAFPPAGPPADAARGRRNRGSLAEGSSGLAGSPPADHGRFEDAVLLWWSRHRLP